MGLEQQRRQAINWLCRRWIVRSDWASRYPIPPVVFPVHVYLQIENSSRHNHANLLAQRFNMVLRALIAL